MTLEKTISHPESTGTYKVVGSFLANAEYDAETKSWSVKDLSSYQHQVNYWMKEEEDDRSKETGAERTN